MKIATLLLINAVLAVGFGLALLGFPVPFLQQYAVELTTAGAVEVARLFGAALVGYGALSLASRTRPETWPVAIITFLVADSLGFVVALHGVLTGATNAMGWSTVAIYFLLAAGYGYFRFAKPVAAVS